MCRKWKRICTWFLLFVYIFIVVGDPINYQRERVDTPFFNWCNRAIVVLPVPNRDLDFQRHIFLYVNCLVHARTHTPWYPFLQRPSSLQFLYIPQRLLNYFGFPVYFTLSVPDEEYSKHVLCALNYTSSVFVILILIVTL